MFFLACQLALYDCSLHFNLQFYNCQNATKTPKNEFDGSNKMVYQHIHYHAIKQLYQFQLLALFSDLLVGRHLMNDLLSAILYLRYLQPAGQLDRIHQTKNMASFKSIFLKMANSRMMQVTYAQLQPYRKNKTMSSQKQCYVVYLQAYKHRFIFLTMIQLIIIQLDQRIW